MSINPKENLVNSRVIKEALTSSNFSQPDIAGLEVAIIGLSHSFERLYEIYSGKFPMNSQLNFLSNLNAAAHREAMNRSIPEQGSKQPVIVVLNQPLELKLSRSDGIPTTVNLDRDQRLMLAHLTSVTDTYLNRYTMPWVSRKAVVESSGNQFNADQLRRRLLNPLKEADLVEASHLGFILQASPRDLRNALSDPSNSSEIKLQPFEKWQADYRGRKVIPSHLIAIVKALESLTDREPRSKFTKEELAETTSRSTSQIVDDLSALKDLGLLARGKRGMPYRIHDISDYLKLIARSQDIPAVKVLQVAPSEAILPRDVQSSEKPKNVPKEKKLFNSPDDLLLLDLGKRKNSIVSIALKNLNPFQTHLPSRIINNGGRLNAIDNKGQLVWDQLISLGLSVRTGRDHHKELTPIGALIAIFFAYPEIAQRASIIGNGKKGAVEVVTLHVAHLLKAVQDKRISISSSEEDNVKLEQFIKGSQEILKNNDLICYCPKCV